jgi:uncharacterized membrane protein
MTLLQRGIQRLKHLMSPGRGIIPVPVDIEVIGKIRFTYLVMPFSILLLVASVFLSIPFFISGVFSWDKMNLYFQGLMFCLVATLFCHAYLSFRLSDTIRLLAVSLPVSYLAESSGIKFAWLFGSSYHYNPAIMPQLPGGVPLFIPLSWFLLCYSALRVFRMIRVRNGDRISAKRIILKAALCAMYITAIDLVIDPIATLYGTWFWHSPGIYFGVPPANFVTWFLVSFIICAITIAVGNTYEDKFLRNSLIPDLLFILASIFLTTLFFIKCTVSLGAFLPVLLALLFLGPVWLYWMLYAFHTRFKPKQV